MLCVTCSAILRVTLCVTVVPFLLYALSYTPCHHSAILGPHMDIHTGGVDLKFPHHDNEIAQAEV